MRTSTLTPLVLALAAKLASACSCTHNGDAGRWIDSNSPGAVASNLASAGGGCQTATVQGAMCVTFTGANAAIEKCMADYAVDATSYHGDWFLWTAIQCTDGDSSSTLSIT